MSKYEQARRASFALRQRCGDAQLIQAWLQSTEWFVRATNGLKSATDEFAAALEELEPINGAVHAWLNQSPAAQ